MPNRFEQFRQQEAGSQNRFAPFAAPERPSALTNPLGFAKGLVDERRESIRKRHEALGQQLGDQFDPSDKFRGGFLSEMDISRSAAPEDRQAKFRQAFPEGELISVEIEGGPVELARSKKDDPFREMRFTPAIAGAVASEPMVGGVAGSLFGPAGTAAGTGAGVVAQQAVEQLRGFGSGEGGIGRAAGEGAIAGLVDVGTRGAARLLRGPKMPKAQRESTIRAVEGAKELGLEPLTIGQISPSPFVRGMFKQVGVTSPRIEQKVAAQEKSLLESFRRQIASGGAEGVSDDALNAVVRAQQRELSQIIDPKALSRTDAGNALQQGVETYKEASRQAVSRLYNRAIAQADDVAFDLTPAQRVAQDVRRGVQGEGRPVTRTEQSPILDQSGQPISREVTERQAVELASTPEGELKAVVDDLLALDPRMDKFATRGAEWDAFTQIKTLRTRLFDLKESSDGAIRREASRLWKELTDVMDSPISGDSNFVTAYKQASRANAIREENLGKSFVAQALRTDTPEVLARKYLNPGHQTELETIRQLVPKGVWEDFRQAFQTDMLRAPNPAQAQRRLDTFVATDPDGLRMILNSREEDALRLYLSTKARFEASPANQILQRNLTEGERLVEIAKRGTAQDVADTVRLAGGMKSPTAQSMKAGVYKDILDSSMDVSTAGVDVLDAGKLMSNIQRWRRSGRLEALFDPSDWKALESVQSYAAPLAETADIGGGMMGGSLRQQAIHAPTETAFGDVKKVGKRLLRPLYSNAATARMLTIPASKARLQLAGRPRKLPIREAAIAYSIMHQELMREDERR